MVDIEAKSVLLRKRVASLAFASGVMDEATVIVGAEGMRLPDAAASLHKEWLNDMVASTDAAEFRHAADDFDHRSLHRDENQSKHAAYARGGIS